MNKQYEDTDAEYPFAFYINDGEYFGAVSHWEFEEPQDWSARNVTVYELGKEEPVFVKGEQLARLPHERDLLKQLQERYPDTNEEES